MSFQLLCVIISYQLRRIKIKYVYISIIYIYIYISLSQIYPVAFPSCGRQRREGNGINLRAEKLKRIKIQVMPLAPVA